VITLGVRSCDCIVSKGGPGPKVGDQIGRELLRLHRLEECSGAFGDHVGLQLLRLHRPEELLGPIVGDHIGRELLRLHRLEEM
jgi:hypothetical protein